MTLDEFSRQMQEMQDRVRRLYPAVGLEAGDFRHVWEETTEALGVTIEELRQQSEELEESRRAVEAERQRYRDLFDLAPDGYLVTDLLGVIQEANRAAGELLGVPPRFLKGKPLASYIDMDERPGFRGGLQRLQRVGRREGWALRLQPRRGTPYQASVTAAVVRDWNGTPMALSWLIREVEAGAGGGAAGEGPGPSGRVTVGLAGGGAGEETSRGLAERDDQALRRLLHGIDVIVWEADAETGRYWFISPRAEEILGHPAESWIEDPGFWLQIIHAEDRAAAGAHRARCLREGRAGEHEYRVVAADGRVVWFRESLGLATDAEGRRPVLRGCLWDISRRKKVERQLYTDRRRLAEHLSDVWHLYMLGGQLLGTLELGPVLEEILSAVTALQGAEMGAVRLLDAEREELETIVSLNLPAEYLERYGRLPVGIQACGLAVKRGGPVIVEDVEADGEHAESWAEPARLGGFRACFSLPMVNRRGELVGTIATFFREPHRPSERQLHLVDQYVLQAADALDNARRHRAALDAGRRREVFLATLAHELRAPLGAIQAGALLLRPDAVDAGAIGEAREMIVRQAGHMARLIEDLLDVSRVSRGTLALRRRPVELAEVAARAIERVRPLIVARRHELAVALPPGSLRLEADPTRLDQILANLLTNAAKYTDPGGRIDLIADREADAVVLRVRDTGIGLTPEAIAGLFQLFNQADGAHERSRGGLGLGLALVKSLVELHGGTVCARSDGPGRGSEFIVRLPA